MPVRALAVLDRGKNDPAQRVHEFRRLMKAWRAVLRLAPAGLAEEARAVRDGAAGLRRCFGTARDATVIAGVLGALYRGPSPEDEARAAAGAMLLEREGFVRAELARLSGEMAGWSVADETGGFLVRAFRRGYRRVRRRAGRDPRRMGLPRLHDWRTAVVDWGYQLGFFTPAEPGWLGPQARAAERLRGRLGKAVDLDMARAYLAAEPPADGGERLAREIGRRIARQRRRAAKLAGRLLDPRPGRVGARLREGLAHRPPRRVGFA